MKQTKLSFIALLTVLLFAALSASGQKKYSLSTIPEELLENAGTVVRTDEREFVISGPASATLTVRNVATLLHKSQRDLNHVVVWYNRFSKIRDLRITIYDKNGNAVYTVPRNEIYDVSGTSGNDLYTDQRFKLYYIEEKFHYPFTIEYSYKRVYTSLLSYPVIMPIASYNTAVEEASFTVEVPAGEDLRYKSVNTDVQPEVQDLGKTKTYTWSFRNLHAIVEEPFDLPLKEIVPAVYLAPGEFEMDNYPGTCDSWTGFGQWIYTLNEGRDELPEETRNEIRELTDGVTDKREKTRLVYEYMQGKTRYVNISMGIGGWQPYDAETVERTGYGDCKALTNYTQALLKEAGIPSYYTLIRAGADEEDIRTDFPSNQFNHAILCVPNDGDTVWLECTSQRMPAGYLGTFTEDRSALIIKNNESRLVRTPALSKDDNLRIRKAVVKLNEDGSYGAVIDNYYSGFYFDQNIPLYFIEGKRRMEEVRKNIHVKDFSLDDQKYKIELIKSEEPALKEHYRLTGEGYVSRMGSRNFFGINFFGTTVSVPPAKNVQETELRINRSYHKIDSIAFVLPEGFTVSSVPKNDSLTSRFGSLTTHFSLNGDTLLYVRDQFIFEGNYPHDSYDELRTYLKKVSKATSRRVGLVPKEK